MSKSEWNGDKIIKQLETKLMGRVKLATEFVESEAKRRCPVDTGNLRDSINSEVEYDAYGGVVGKIGTNVEYAAYQEFSTKHQSGKSFLRPSLLENKEQIKKIICGESK